MNSVRDGESLRFIAATRFMSQSKQRDGKLVVPVSHAAQSKFPNAGAQLELCSRNNYKLAAMNFWFRRVVSDEHTFRKVKSEQRSLSHKPPSAIRSARRPDSVANNLPSGKSESSCADAGSRSDN